MRLIIPTTILALAALGAARLPAQVEDLQSTDPKIRKSAVSSLGTKGDKQKTDAQVICEAVGGLVRDPDPSVREEVVIALTKTGTMHCQAPLIQMTKDASPDIQAMAVDGLVNFYVPGYVQFGWLSSVKGFGGKVKDRFRTPEPTIVDPYVEVSPDVIDAIGALISGGSSMDSRAEAARAVGILRGRAAIPELRKGLQSRDKTIMIESVRSIQKIGDLSAGPDVVPLLRDPDSSVREVAAETVGQLRTREAVDDLVKMSRADRDKKVQRAALTALAKIPDNGQDRLFLSFLTDRDNQLRGAAAEGLGRHGNAQDLRQIQDAFAGEKSESVRQSMAFAAVKLGDMNMLSYLIDGLTSRLHRAEARAFLVELAREPRVLSELHGPLTSGTEQQKIELAHVVGRSGTKESEPHLERLTRDPNTKVADAALRELKNLRSRL